MEPWHALKQSQLWDCLTTLYTETLNLSFYHIQCPKSLRLYTCNAFFKAKTMTRTFRLEIEPYQTTSNSKFVRPDSVEGLHFQETSTGIWPNAIEHLWQTYQKSKQFTPTCVFFYCLKKVTKSIKLPFLNAYEQVEDGIFQSQKNVDVTL